MPPNFHCSELLMGYDKETWGKGCGNWRLWHSCWTLPLKKTGMAGIKTMSRVIGGKKDKYFTGLVGQKYDIKIKYWSKKFKPSCD